MPDKQEVFEYLVTLRDSGVTNMFGAPPYVAKQFGISTKEATALFWEWTETFK